MFVCRNGRFDDERLEKICKGRRDKLKLYCILILDFEMIVAVNVYRKY